VITKGGPMKKISLWFLALAVLLGSFGTANADVYVRSYFRRNGVYVTPHYRSDPDGIIWNNWSVYPNINPYTGRRGMRRIW
jgi:hypothetical protein